MNARTVFVPVLSVASCAFAQAAIIQVTHNDPDGIVAAGETVQITTTISWQVAGQSALYAIGGGVQATPNVGAASNSVFPYGSLPGSPTIAPGTPFLGSVRDVYLEYGDLNWWLFGYLPSEPWIFSGGFEVVRFDWIAPAAPGVVAFDWTPSATLTQPHIASSLWNPPVQPVPATYFGASLTVVPAPPASLLLLGSGLLAIRRKR